MSGRTERVVGVGRHVGRDVGGGHLGGYEQGSGSWGGKVERGIPEVKRHLRVDTFLLGPTPGDPRLAGIVVPCG